MNPTAQKNQRLGLWLKEQGSCLVAFSGGVDSSFLLARAVQELGERAQGFLLVSPSLPDYEVQSAVQVAQSLGAILHQEQAPEPAAVAANPPDRCYHCKSFTFERVQAKAQELRLAKVLDGTNAEDLHEYRPGLQAAREQGVLSPLAELGFTKNEIRHLSKEQGLANWDKPSFPCLNSRVPYGEPITPQKLEQIGQGELRLKALGFAVVRLRHHGEIARIEVPLEDFAKALHFRAEMEAALKDLGFRYVTLDLTGFRSGSLNPLS